MIPKKNRFTTRRFERAFRRSRRIRTPYGVVLITREKHLPKIAVVVGKKITKSAPKRNRLRRQIYEMLRTDLLPYLSEMSVIWLYNGPEKLENPAVLRTEIRSLLH